MRAHLLLPAMGKHPASAWSAGAQPAPTHDQSGLQPFPALCPGALRCRTTRLYYTCSVSTRRGAHDRPSPSFPCTCKHGSGKRQGKVDVEVGTTRIRKLSRLSGHHRASVGAGPVPLRFLLSTLLLRMKQDTADRFMRDPIRGCHFSQRFLLLHHTLPHRRPL